MPTPKVLSIQRVRALREEVKGLPYDEVFQFWETHGREIVECAQHSATLTSAVLGKERHALALECLRETSENNESAVAMWNDESCRDVLLHACQLTDPSDQKARENALNALIDLSMDSSVAQAMWRHGVCRRTIRDACMEELMPCSVYALWCLNNLLAEQGDCVTEFWIDSAFRQAVVAHAASGGECTTDVQAREEALRCLGNVASCEPDVWWDADSRRAILNASKVGTDASLCVVDAALWTLKKLTEHAIQDSMWDDLECRRCLVDAVKFNGWETSDPPQNSLWALENLATRPRIRAEMILETDVLQSVTTACQSEEEAVQWNAIRLLVQLTDVTTLSIVWTTTWSILAPLLHSDHPHFEDVLELLADLARDPFVAADMVAKFPTIPALADEAAALAGDDKRTRKKHGSALRVALPASQIGASPADIPDLSLAELPPDLVSGKLRPAQRVAAIEEWVGKVETVIKSNQRTVDTEITATTSQYNESVSTAVQGHFDRVADSMASLKQQMDEAATLKGARMLKITEASTKLDLQRTELSEAKENLEEARAMLAVFKDSGSQSKRKGTDAPELETPTTKRGRSDVLTPPDSAAGPATRERPAYHFCPITHEVMVDPVVAADGLSYERSAITEWLSKSNTSPMHGSELRCSSLHANQVLKQLIVEWMD